MSTEQSFHTIVIGGGQAGLAAGYFLTKNGESFVILDAGSHVGEVWRHRWDSLRLFTPSQFDGLPGMPFPKPDYYSPTKDEVAEYLEAYARQFNLPIRHSVKVESLNRDNDSYRLSAGANSFSAKNVIIATGPFQSPYTPAFAKELDPGIQQLHSSAYRNPEQISSQTVLVVGAGNSGAEIALDLSKVGKRVWLAGRDVGHIPANTLGKAFGGRPYWWFISRVLSVDTPIGRKMRSNVLYHGNPLIRAHRQEVINAGIECTPRVSGIQSGKPQTEDGQTLEVESIVWATGFHPDFRWINLPVFDEHGYPRHQRGVSQEAPGLYFVGLHFQTALISALLGGVGADASYIAGQIARNGRSN
ncbi:MAG: NAD(P)-binding domain-containing protein [Anaerolineales bacterium]|nr:NAD(P)-binding domain-containing protein [Anaerolineales bacterium]